MLDILFVQNFPEFTFGIMQISALLKQHGFTTDVAMGTNKDIVDKTLEKRPRVLGFYCTTGFHHKNIAAAREVKRILADEILTIFGGPHPTFVPSLIETEGVDIICRGEGEYAVLELIQALHEGKDYTGIKNLTVKKDGKIYENGIRPLCDIDALAHFDRELYRNVKYVYKNKRQEVILGRGCPFDCTFCSNHAFKKLYEGKGNYVRFRSIGNVMEELEDIKSRYNPYCFYFFDDTFILKKDYCTELLNAYKDKINLPFACLVRADLITEDLVKLFKEAGCYYVEFGIESGNEKLRNIVLKKKISDEDIFNCAALLHKYKIPFRTLNMVGLPDETLREVWDTVNINIQVKPKWAWFSVYQTLPQTELAQYSLDKGYLDSIDVAESDASFHASSGVLRNNPEGRKMLRLKNTANIVIKIPASKALIEKIIVNLPLDFVYDLMDKFLYFIFHYSKLSYKQGFFRTVYSAFYILRHLKEFK